MGCARMKDEARGRARPRGWGPRALPACGRVRVTHCVWCVPGPGWGPLAMLSVLAGVTVLGGDLCGVCLCKRVQAGVWLTPCMEHTPLGGGARVWVAVSVHV